MPPAAGLAVNIVVAWLLLLSGAMHLAFAWYTRTRHSTLGGGCGLWAVVWQNLDATDVEELRHRGLFLCA
jgi:hypothetical protein